MFAGKTTTINMLTGMTPPTSGDANVNGFSVCHAMDAVRANLGVCPQYDILFDLLTVEEHLRLYAKLKGVQGSEVQLQVDVVLKAVDLDYKRSAFSSALSGGMKRKLSVGISLIGGSKVCFCDEPSSGMDPASRRKIWEVLKQAREGRTIVLTTHFMDEADVLGDRIAILSAGKLRAAGTSHFLKSRFGVGYTLTLVSDQNSAGEKLREAVTASVPNAKVVSDAGSELSFSLPFTASSVFPELLTQFEQERKELALGSYGLSVTTLEEVFLKVAQGELTGDTLNDVGFEKDDLSPSNSVLLETDNQCGFGARFRHLGAVFSKRTAQARRDVRSAVFIFLIPISAVLFGLVFVTVLGSQLDQAKLKLSFGDAFQESSTLTVPYAGELSPTAAAAFHAAMPEVELMPHGQLSHQAASGTTFPCKKASTYSKSWFGSALQDAVPAAIAKQYLSDGKYSRVAASVANCIYSQFCCISAGADVQHNFTEDTFDTGDFGTACPAADLAVMEHCDADTPEGQALRSILEVGEHLVEATAEPGNKLRHFGATVFRSAELDEYTVLHNTAAPHALPTWINALDTARLKLHDSQQSLTVTTQPWPLTSKQKVRFELAAGLLVSLLITMGLCFVPAAFTSYIVRERERKTIHQQQVSGLSLSAYFVGNLIWDLLSFMVAMVVIIALFFMFAEYAPAYTHHLLETVLVFFLYGLSSTAFAYAVSFLFTSYSTATVVSLVVNIVTGLLFMITSFILQGIDENTRAVNNVLIYFFYLSPSFCLGNSLLAIFAVYAVQTVTEQFDIDADDALNSFVDLWSYKAQLNVVVPITYMSCGFFVYFFTAIALQSCRFDCVSQLSSSKSEYTALESEEEEDEDVQAERLRVESGQAAADGDVIRLYGLRKVYPARRNVGPKVAVAGSSFAIKNGECFGLLGINGAGKTTTMSMLTGEFRPTSGSATLAGYDAVTQRADVYRNLGFCPQFDALFEKLTAREHLLLYATIRGVPAAKRKRVIDRIISDLDLGDFENKLAGTYSGGNRRKLSVGIALIGDPPIIFMDEPSTGMDPVARRFMWGVISRTMSGRSVILTTHSMEESEALCHRIAIMVGGRLQCIGSAQHLKSRFGTGYTIEARAKQGSPLSHIEQYLTTKYPESNKLDSQGGQLRVQIQMASVSGLAEVFTQLESVKLELGLESYSVGQTTLEQVFLSKASENPPED
eukprot:TRINITY_DN4497_c0_g1_i4.p1 TRINITY_DN4497_c0_g1~~TRINITY_DN4497_c0_g1_i4.p1  ORF type:complete len:1202 (+),score=309.02 TRINITY_DN4497_c0_g1_i4:2333-5938(+)